MILIQYKRDNNIVSGELIYKTSSCYFLKSLDINSRMKIRKEEVKKILSTDELYAIVKDLDSKTYIRLAKVIDDKKANMGCSKIVFATMVEMGLI